MLIYVVRPGDVLWRIAARYGVEATSIAEVNGLSNPNQLLIGQALVIPTEDQLHTVRAGETLWRIAQTYGTTVEAIIQANNITNPNLISPGDRLIIPAQRYRVNPGETLWDIAQRFGVSLRSLIDTNDISNPNLIYPGTTLIIPLNPGPIIETNGYIYLLGEDAVPIVREDGEHLTYLSPFAYRVREDGTLQSINDSPAIRAAYAEDVVPMMCITNFTVTELGENLAHVILLSPEIQQTLLTNIISTMRQKGYQGLNIDFENVLPEDRELYNQFLQRTVNRLHPEGFFVSTAVAPKVSGEQRGLLYEAHDYPAHGRIVDFVILMTYEWGWRLGPPQAISPLNEMKRVVDYAVSVMPRNKIMLGFQIYARDWVLPHRRGQEAETFSMEDAMERAVRYGATIQYDSIAESPFYRYTDEEGVRHEVWFEDARSAQAKFDLVKAYNLRGISYWALGYPFPENWALLESNFSIDKEI